MQPAVSTTRLKIEFAQASDPGRDPNKQVNEDSCGYAESRFGHLCVLCDGMGGHYGGKEASRTAITTIFEVIEQTPAGTSPSAALKAAIEEAGRRVYRLGGPPENRTRPGSTVVAMLLHDRGVDVAHVGDSRAYVIRSNQIYPLTRDHSMVQGMIDAGMLTEEQAIGHPDANKITRALGMKPEVDVEVRPEPMELFPGDVLLQSSDGLTDLALGADILGATRQALASGPVSHACNMLVQLANNRGGHDNITVQMVRVQEIGPKGLQTIPQAPGAGSPNAFQVQAGSPQAAPPETISMTSPDRAPQSAYGAQQQGNRAPQAASSGPGMQWAPVPPTAADAPQNRGPMPPAGHMPMGPGPTVNEGQPASSAWTSGQYNGPPVQGGPQAMQQPNAGPQGGLGAPPPRIGAYSLEAGAGALPLPPASMRPGFDPAFAGGAPAPYAGAMQGAYTPMPASVSTAGARPSKGGIVFVIIGLSAVIAVLILVLLWALVLR